jgi:hypothetical protein
MNRAMLISASVRIPADLLVLIEGRAASMGLRRGQYLKQLALKDISSPRVNLPVDSKRVPEKESRV